MLSQFNFSEGYRTASLPLFILAFSSLTFLLASIAIYRLYFHPLSKFAGPTSACLSQRWLLNLSNTGKAEKTFARLHQKYNTSALRIGPNELHIDDVKLYKVIYNQSDPFPKYKSFYDAFGTPHTVFVETDKALHKERRRLLNPFFSRTMIMRLEPYLVETTIKLGKRLDNPSPTTPINMSNAFRCLTVDIISEYAFGKSLDLTNKSDANFDHDFMRVFDILARGIWNFAYRPSLRLLAAWTPRWLAEKSPQLSPIFGLIDYAKSSLSDLYQTPETQKAVIFKALDSISLDEAIAEAMDFFAAGSDTTAYTLTFAVAHLIRNSNIKKKLSSALFDAIPDPSKLPSATELEKIPYLMACVKESLRTAKAVPGRLPRVVPPDRQPFIVDNKTVPVGTIVGMSATSMHDSHHLWGSDATSFNPDRWLEEKALDQHLVSFSKGARNCIGQNMALLELTIVLAFLFRRFDFEFVGGSGIPEARDFFTSSVDNPLLVRAIPLN